LINISEIMYFSNNGYRYPTLIFQFKFVLIDDFNLNLF